MPILILLRHGQSQWNLENRFTGWVDVDLTETGEAQARKGGELIAAEGLHVDEAFTSVQTWFHRRRSSASSAGCLTRRRSRSTSSLSQMTSR